MRPILILLLTFSSNCFSITVDECVNIQEELGSHGISEKDISIDCYDIFKSLANKQGIHKDEVSHSEVIVYKNAIYFKDLNTKKFDIDAGSSTTLNNAVAVDYNSENSEFYVIDNEDFSMKSFSSSIMGNVAPYRTLKSDDLIGAIDLVSFKEKIYILNSMTNKVLVYNRMANIYQRKNKQFIGLVDVIENISSDADSINLNNEKIEVKDKDNNVLQAIIPKN